ncbi:MAG: MoxR-like ATPase [Flavobacteriales bacterium]|jgi:MoxR-like ATPase
MEKVIQASTDALAIDALKETYVELTAEISKVIVGQHEVVRDVVLAIIANGHCLLEGVPGLAKTLLVNTISETLGLNFNRIQFTPDLMPSDITGSEILDNDRKFTFVKGPLFSQILLADEINRTPPKTQAALLEAMQEKVVTVGGKRYPLEQPFFVLATQNPIEQEGTYSLPEAQLDRFMFNIKVGYPTYEEELSIVKNTTSNKKVSLDKILTGTEILKIQDLIRKMPVAENVLEYAVTLVGKSRPDSLLATDNTKNYVAWGAGPRASQYLVLGAKAHAAIKGKYSPDIEDVKAIAHAVLRHRIVRNYKAEADGMGMDDLIDSLM